MRRLLGINKPPEQRARRWLWDLEAFQGRLEIDFQDRDDPINLPQNNDADGDGERRNQNGEAGPDGDAENPLGDGEAGGAEANEVVVRVTPYSIGRVIASALMLPSISKWMGSLLYRCATGLRLVSLQRFLGIKYPRPPPMLLTRLDSFAGMDPV